MNFSIVNDSDDEQNSVIYEFNHDDKCFIEIDVFLLFQISNYSSCFITQNFIHDFSFESINSFNSKRSTFRKKYNQFINVINDDKVYFFLHICVLNLLILISYCLFINLRFIEFDAICINE